MSLLALVLFARVPDAQAQSYERLYFDGRPACRASRTFSYAVSTYDSNPTAAQRAAIEAAVDTWRQAASACSDLVFEQTADATNPYQELAEGSAVITLRTRNCVDFIPPDAYCWEQGTCGEASCWAHPRLEVVKASVGISLTSRGYGDPLVSRIVRTHIELNASNGHLTTIDGPPCPSGVTGPDCVVGDVQSLVTRSIGEALGLTLVARTDSTMSSSLQWGETHKRTLDPGTLQGLCELFPRGKPTPGCENVRPMGESGPSPIDWPDKKGCSTTSSTPLFGALLLLLGLRRSRTRA